MIPFPRYALLALVALLPSLAQAQPIAPSLPRMAPETVLADNGIARVTRADYDLELTKLPPEVRGGFATSEKRVVDLINRLLVTKTLSAQADAAGLPQDPETARRLAAEFEKVKAQLMVQKLERDAAAKFDANPAPFEARARELYLIDPKRFDVPAQVSASHILFATPPHSLGAATKLAAEARAQIAAGADFNAVARERSDDPSAKQNEGRLGFFGPGQMDPDFEKAAFALAKVGDVSEPVVSSFGVHLIRLEGRKGAARQTFEQARPRIMLEQRTQFIASERDAALEAIKDAALKGTDMEKVNGIVVRVDAGRLDQMSRESLQRQQQELRERALRPPK